MTAVRTFDENMWLLALATSRNWTVKIPVLLSDYNLVGKAEPTT
jgi:hypothetical protein